MVGGVTLFPHFDSWTWSLFMGEVHHVLEGDLENL
jgi:hypothetical protein